MKKILFTAFAITCFSLYSFGQDPQTEKNKFLYNAILNNDMDKVTKLLNDGADANYVYTNKEPEVNASMLIIAVKKKSINMVKLLIEHKADVNFRDVYNTTAIIYAASTGSKILVELLLKNGANIHDDSGDGNTVLSAAKESKNVALINFVKEKLK